MRTYSNGNIAITYPDKTCWLYDNLFVKISSLNGTPVGGKVVVTDVSSGNYRKLEYNSELDTVVFALGDTFLSLYHDGMTFNVVVTPSNAGAGMPQFAFDLEMLEGRTLPARKHGSERTIYVYVQEDLQKLQFLFPATGGLSTPNGTIAIPYGGYTALDLRQNITEYGENLLCFTAGVKPGKDEDSLNGVLSIVNVTDITPWSGCAVLEWQDTSGVIPPDNDRGGGIWGDEAFRYESYCIVVNYSNVCDNFNYFKVRYINTDGLTRYLGGKILEEGVESKGNNFYTIDTVTPYNKLSKRFVTEARQTVKVGYPELRRDSYWSDILLSPKIEFRDVQGEWHECSIKTSKVAVKSEEEMDVELEFEIFAY